MKAQYTIPRLSVKETHTVLLENEAATLSFAKAYARSLIGNETVIVSGAMGSGKSVLIRGILRTLGVDDWNIPSPTFTLIHPYLFSMRNRHPSKSLTAESEESKDSLGDDVTEEKHRKTVFHIDLYRLERESELTALGMTELLAQSHLVFIEWGEKFPSLLRAADYHLSLSFNPHPNPEQVARHSRDDRYEDSSSSLPPHTPSTDLVSDAWLVHSCMLELKRLR